MLGTLIKSFKKSIRLKKISKNLSKVFDSNDILNFQERDKVLNENFNMLFEICQSDKNVNLLLEKNKIDSATLKEIYNLLKRYGSGQYAGGHYVAASSLVFPSTLQFLLEHYKGNKFEIKEYDEKNSALFIVTILLKYFEKGEVGEVKY